MRQVERQAATDLWREVQSAAVEASDGRGGWYSSEDVAGDLYVELLAAGVTVEEAGGAQAVGKALAARSRRVRAAESRVVSALSNVSGSRYDVRRSDLIRSEVVALRESFSAGEDDGGAAVAAVELAGRVGSFGAGVLAPVGDVHADRIDHRDESGRVVYREPWRVPVGVAWKLAPDVVLDGATVERAVSVLDGWAGVEAPTIRDRAAVNLGPATTCEPVEYAARIRSAEWGRAQVERIVGRSIGSGLAASCAAYWVRTVAAWNVEAAGSVPADVTAFAAGLHGVRAREFAQAVKLGDAFAASRFAWSAVGELLDVLDSAPEWSQYERPEWESVREDGPRPGPVVASVLTLGQGGTFTHELAAVRWDAATQAGAWVPSGEVHGIRLRESGATVGDLTRSISHAGDVGGEVERRAFADALARALHRRTPRRAGRGRPAFDLLRALDGAAARFGLSGVGDPGEPLRLSLPGPGVVGVGSLSAVDLLAFVGEDDGSDGGSLGLLLDRQGRKYDRPGVNVSALADVLGSVGVEVERRALGRALGLWGERALGAAYGHAGAVGRIGSGVTRWERLRAFCGALGDGLTVGEARAVAWSVGHPGRALGARWTALREACSARDASPGVRSFVGGWSGCCVLGVRRYARPGMTGEHAVTGPADVRRAVVLHSGVSPTLLDGRPVIDGGGGPVHSPRVSVLGRLALVDPEAVGAFSSAGGALVIPARWLSPGSEVEHAAAAAVHAAQVERAGGPATVGWLPWGEAARVLVGVLGWRG